MQAISRPISAALLHPCRAVIRNRTGSYGCKCRWEAAPVAGSLSTVRHASSSSSSGAYGSEFMSRAKEVRDNHAGITSAEVAASGPPPSDETKEPEEETRKQIRRLLEELPGHTSATTAYFLHRTEKLEPKVKPPLSKEEFESLYSETRTTFFKLRRSEVSRRRRHRRDHMRLNTGYKEEDDVYEATEEEFTDEWRQKSIAEDVWKAEFYQQVASRLQQDIPDPEPLAARSDRIADVLRGSLRRHFSDQNRPVLTHELADFENPYMMRRSAIERLLHERCVRNQLDERCMPRLLDRDPDLVKLRSQAAMPPEVLEPLAAFRGDVRWNFDVRERLTQKLSAAEVALEAIVANTSENGSAANAATIAEVLPENVAEYPAEDQVSGISHPWRNHAGFESQVPRGMAGGTKFGQPMAAVPKQILGLRYPTLQRVAHTLPSDPKWRAHVVRSIRVLERAKDWDFEKKLTAVHKLKEVYDQLKPSDYYTQMLDEKLPVNRVPSHLKRKYAPDAQYIRTYPKHWLKKKSYYRYRPSLTTVNPLKKAGK
eukprot:TRINITY_DN95957_c0_g1_i1.p1 TRINITY_DN95957_c0_g1~~TRINITY_DN95957_c0_g1_i1.p1  ORF type:complete len:541 (-),score=97.32 TRINITY_DN95957_c0_g1_i1:89-1711(-)